MFAFEPGARTADVSPIDPGAVDLGGAPWCTTALPIRAPLPHGERDSALAHAGLYVLDLGRCITPE